jgi:hypothetical protein
MVRSNCRHPAPRKDWAHLAAARQTRRVTNNIAERPELLR